MKESVKEAMGMKGLLLVQILSELSDLCVGLSHFQWVIFEYHFLLALVVVVLQQKGLVGTPSSC